MSRMDSWSRPGKSQATPPPYYLLPGGESTPYCRSCGRVISARRAGATRHDTAKDGQGPSYCSQRCRNTKPGRIDRGIEAAFVRMLSGGEADGDGAQGRQNGKHKEKVKGKPATTKGDPRMIVSCDAVERAVLGDEADPEKSFGRKKNRASGALLPAEADEAIGDNKGNVEDDDSDEGNSSASSVDADVLARMAVRSGTRVRPSQRASLVNGSVGGEKGRAERATGTEEMATRRLGGQRRARRREMVRCAARRGAASRSGSRSGGGRLDKLPRRRRRLASARPSCRARS
ncbi:hypothetical protein GGR52DRAFT_589863 [Hypoxylon sp. FL1284]|nr:hypothetical protein GGR52DRAFT_589863 [Hypoxylon sp. FL1284]